MPPCNRSYAIVQPQGHSPLRLRVNCHGSFKRLEACAPAGTRMNIPAAVPSLQTAGVLRNSLICCQRRSARRDFRLGRKNPMVLGMRNVQKQLH